MKGLPGLRRWSFVTIVTRGSTGEKNGIVSSGPAPITWHGTRRRLAHYPHAGIKVYIEGGWGVDALLGHQTRPHSDLDLDFDATQERWLIETMRQFRFAMSSDQRPTRFVMHDATGREIDFHPVTFDATGAGIQVGPNGEHFQFPADGFTQGSILGQPVPCITAELQVQFHTGYTPKKKDLQDMSLLHATLGVPLPASFP